MFIFAYYPHSQKWWGINDDEKSFFQRCLWQRCPLIGAMARLRNDTNFQRGKFGLGYYMRFVIRTNTCYSSCILSRILLEE
jgi:hypothetical protein